MSKTNRILSRTKEADDSQADISFSSSQNSGSSQPVAGIKAPVLLRRTAEGKPSSLTPTSTKQQVPVTTGDEQQDSGGVEKKPQILMRTGTSSEHKDRSDRERSGNTAPSLYDILKAYEFPYENAVPLVHNDLTFLTDRQFLKPIRSTLDYLVVTAIGPPGSGKSTVLNYLAGKSKNGAFLTAEPKIFLPRKDKDEGKMSSFYISPENIVFIEMAPIFSGSAAVDLIQFVDKFSTLESLTVSWNLRLMRWALSVSHLVLILGSSVIEPKTIQLIHSASTLHPMESSFGEDCHPELMFVANKCRMSDEALEEWISICNSPDVLGLGRSARLKPNAFAIPPYSKANNLNEFPEGKQSCEAFRQKIYEYNQWTRSSFTEDAIEGGAKIPQSQTLNDWLTFAGNCWDEMGHAPYFHDYVKLF